MIFPQKGVRFIAINDGVDSAQGDNDFAPLRNIFNEWLVRDTSKKIKAVKRSKGMSGKPITSKPVYGYLMDEDENFIIDEEAAPVVKQIYNLCLAGNGPTKIARMLTEQQIPTPGTLEYRRTGSTRRYHPGYECKWATNTVVHILENREYTGCLVNFKTEKPSYKSQAQRRKSPGKASDFREPPRAYHRHPDMGTGAGTYANSANAPTAMMKWACSPAYCSVRTAAASCISSDTRRTSASRTVISAATTRNAPMTVRRTLSAPTS